MANIKPYVTLPNGVKLYVYAIYQGKKIVENRILGWRTALAHARKWSNDLFSECMRIEILNYHTGEIITLEEAERRAKRHQNAVH